jgi:hypothetical protein
MTEALAFHFNLDAAESVRAAQAIAKQDRRPWKFALWVVAILVPVIALVLEEASPQTIFIYGALLMILAILMLSSPAIRRWQIP